jgi:hypothetical protein
MRVAFAFVLWFGLGVPSCGGEGSTADTPCERAVVAMCERACDCPSSDGFLHDHEFANEGQCRQALDLDMGGSAPAALEVVDEEPARVFQRPPGAVAGRTARRPRDARLGV